VTRAPSPIELFTLAREQDMRAAIRPVIAASVARDEAERLGRHFNNTLEGTNHAGAIRRA
jgi:hypothetical protein